MLSLVDQDLVVVWYGRYQVLTGMSLGFYECDFFPEEILIRYMLFYISVVFLECHACFVPIGYCCCL